MWCGVRPYVQFSYACCSAPPLLQHPLLSLTLLLEPTLPPLPRPSLHLLACSSRHHRLAIEAIHPLSPPLGTRYKKSSSSPPSPHYSNEPLTNEGKKGKPLPIPSAASIRARVRARIVIISGVGRRQFFVFRGSAEAAQTESDRDRETGWIFAAAFPPSEVGRGRSRSQAKSASVRIVSKRFPTTD